MKIKLEHDIDIDKLVSDIAGEIQDRYDFRYCWSDYFPEAYWDDCNENKREEVQRVVDALVISELTKRMERGDAIF